MSMLDGILGAATGGNGIADIAGKLGIDPSIAEQAVAALGASHEAPGDTVEQAAQSSGLDRGTVASVMEMLGGDSALGNISQMMKDHPQASAMMTQFLDRDGDGSVVDDIAGMAGKFFGKS